MCINRIMQRGKCIHKTLVTLIVNDRFSLYRCGGCELIFNKNFLVRGKVNRKLYDNYYKNETGHATGKFRFGLENVVRAFRLLRAFRVVTLIGTEKEILDIGCGRGWTLYFLKHLWGYKRTAATQISKPAYIYAKDRLGLEVYNKDILDLRLKNESFDAITIWHVLEHVQQPLKYLPLFFRLLRPGGTLIIEVPNYGSWTMGISGVNWLGLDLKYHLTYYTVDSLKKFAVDSGFIVKKVRTFSLEYSTFVSAQSLASKLTGTNNLFFSMTQGEKVGREVVLDMFLIGILLPICFLVNLVLYYSKNGEVIVLVAQKPNAG